MDQRRGPCMAPTFPRATERYTSPYRIARLFCLRLGKLTQEIFIHPTQNILAFVFFVPQADRADKINQLAEAMLVQSRAGIIFRQNSAKRGVVFFNSIHGIVNDFADSRLFGVLLQILPAGNFGNIKNIFSAIFVCILRVGTLVSRVLRRVRWKASEIYLRKIRPRTTCLYSAASIFL